MWYLALQKKKSLLAIECTTTLNNNIAILLHQLQSISLEIKIQIYLAIYTRLKQVTDFDRSFGVHNMGFPLQPEGVIC